jgi:hypothetical protein
LNHGRIVVNNRWIGKDAELIGCGLIQATIPASAWKNWAKSRISSVRIVGILTEIRNGQPSKTSQKSVGFEVVTGVIMMSSFFGVITPCGPLTVNPYLWGIYRLYLQGRRISQAELV